MEEISVRLLVTVPGSPPTEAVRIFQLPTDALRAAGAAARIEPWLPSVAAWKAAAVDARPWKCYSCGTAPAVEFPCVLNDVPAGGGWARSLLLMCVPRCAAPKCIAKEAKYTEALMDPRVMDLDDATRELDFRPVHAAVALWSAGGTAEIFRAAFELPAADKDGTMLASNFASILHRVRADAASEGLRTWQDWRCVGCRRATSAYRIRISTVAVGDAEQIDVGIFPHCDVATCRERSDAGHAADYPVALGEGCLCAAVGCRAFATERSRGMQRCGKCKSMRYCSPECQRKDWSRHKAVCQPREGR
ncbi:hypothetical protein DFJ74DRAFT_644872 [Hyaloraphidium curvatum]|nr:hypothetical protein DFJ74DRAFT_644872 [Hyaloraphidium curvatum]